jgi:ankyrin repeat protein
MRHLFALALLCLALLPAPAPVLAATPADPTAALFAALKDETPARAIAALDAGAQVNARDAAKNTPLLLAAVDGNAAMVAALLAHGADILARDDQEYRAFDLAVERYNREAAQALLEYWISAGGSDAQRAASRIALAAAKNDLPAVRAALDAGVPADAIGDSGYTALALAARWGRIEIVELLLARGAKPDLGTSSRYGATPLMEASRDGRVEIARKLIAAGASVNTGDRYGDHALNWAAYFGHAPFVALLLEHKPDLQRTGQSDDWPIEIAIRQGHPDVVALLAKAGATARPGKDKPPAMKPAD